MPKLLVFVPCEKVIIDKESNNTTLISLLESLRVQIKRSEAANIPPNAKSPMSWFILSLWQVEPGDELKQWEQRVLVELSEPMEAVLPINFEPNKPNYRNVINIDGFPLNPILTIDRCLIKLFLREKGSDWNFVGEFPIIIDHPND